MYFIYINIYTAAGTLKNVIGSSILFPFEQVGSKCIVLTGENWTESLSKKTTFSLVNISL